MIPANLNLCDESTEKTCQIHIDIALHHCVFLILLYFTASCVFVAFDSVAFHCYTSTYYRFAVARLSYFAMLHRTVLCTFHCPIAWCSMSLLDVCHLLQFLMSRFMRLILLLYFTVFLFIFPIPCVLLYHSI